jgi:hypothetical protein
MPTTGTVADEGSTPSVSNLAPKADRPPHHRGVAPGGGGGAAPPRRHHLAYRSSPGVVAAARSHRRKPPPSRPARPSPRNADPAMGAGSGPGNAKTCAAATGAAARTPTSPSGLPRPRVVDPARGEDGSGRGRREPATVVTRVGEAAPLRRPGVVPPTRGGPTAAILGARTGSRPASLAAAGREGPGGVLAERWRRRPSRPRRGRPERDVREVICRRVAANLS